MVVLISMGMRCCLFGFIVPFIPYVARNRGVGLRAGYGIKLDKRGFSGAQSFLFWWEYEKMRAKQNQALLREVA